jgi:uncharacterized protein YecE (DUF72 family)
VTGTALYTQPHLLDVARLPKSANKMSSIYLGTSAFTAAGWSGTFYPPRMQPRDYLAYYATKFDTLEIDSTYYSTPSPSVVTGWAAKTPPGFLLSAKIPQVITHDKCLVDCDLELKTFVDRMSIMGEKLGPLLLQFPYFNQNAFEHGQEFLDRLKLFLPKLPTEVRFALEIRNKHWLTAEFFELLHAYDVAYALTDQSFMPRIDEIFEKFDLITTDFTYIRWLGDRKAIERVTKVWNRIVWDRTAEMTSWVDVCKKIQRRGVTIFGYFNNHYCGFAPASVQMFRDMCTANGLELPPLPTPAPHEATLFDTL